MLGWPSTRVTGGSPVALAWNAVPSAQVAPGSKEPVNVSFPVQPEPPSGPVAVNWIGPVEGVFVMPGLKVMMPVGAAGVPPQVQNVSPCPAAALPAVARSPTAVVAITSATARDLMVSSFRRYTRLGGSTRLAQSVSTNLRKCQVAIVY